MDGRSVPALPTIPGVVVADPEKPTEGPQRPNAFLECHICSKPPTDPVATSCGHVFCWPCVFSFVENKRKRKPCPVCGTYLMRDMNVLPLYCTGGGAGATDVPRASSGDAIPPRRNNPRMFMPPFASFQGSSNDGSDLGTPVHVSMLQHIEREIQRARARNENMVVEFKREDERLCDDNARVELAVETISRMALDIARLEGELAEVSELPPNEWSDSTVADSIAEEASLHDVVSPSNQP